MKDVVKMFLTFAVIFWLVILHWATFYFIDINGKTAIVMGVLLAHVDMLLMASLFTGYDKHQQVQELEDVIHKDERQAVLESTYEENKRYREVIKKAIDDLENECLWDTLVALKELEGED